MINKDYCDCGRILQLYEKDGVCDFCYKKEPESEHDKNLKDLATIVGGADRRKDGKD